MVDYSKSLDEWYRNVSKEAEPPTAEQMSILTDVGNRLRTEVILEKMGHDRPQTDRNLRQDLTPLLGFVHGGPGTGKTRLIKWIRSMFTDAMRWEHGVEFLFAAVQNRVAFAMGGKTIHAGGDIGVGDKCSRKLEHCDVDILFTRNQLLRFLVIDEGPMIPDQLLRIFGFNLTDAATKNVYW